MTFEMECQQGLKWISTSVGDQFIHSRWSPTMPSVIAHTYNRTPQFVAKGISKKWAGREESPKGEDAARTEFRRDRGVICRATTSRNVQMNCSRDGESKRTSDVAQLCQKEREQRRNGRLYRRDILLGNTGPDSRTHGSAKNFSYWDSFLSFAATGRCSCHYLSSSSAARG